MINMVMSPRFLLANLDNSYALITKMETESLGMQYFLVINVSILIFSVNKCPRGLGRVSNFMIL